MEYGPKGNSITKNVNVVSLFQMTAYLTFLIDRVLVAVVGRVVRQVCQHWLQWCMVSTLTFDREGPGFGGCQGFQLSMFKFLIERVPFAVVARFPRQVF